LLALLGVALPARSQELTVVEQIVEATRLLQNGRLEEAQAIVTRLRAQPNPDQQVLFLSGALHFIAGRYMQAAEEYRLMLARDPSLIRPRLELARALFLAGDYNTARYHFEQTLASPLPESVRTNVLNYLIAIREHLPSYSFAFDIVSDTNPKQATNREVVEIGGALFKLNEDAKAAKALGVAIVGQAKIPLPASPSWYTRAYLEGNDYEGNSLDFWYGSLSAGKHINFGPHGVDFEAGWHASNSASNTLYQGGIFRVSDFIRIRQTVGLTVSADSKNLRYEDFPFLTGWQNTGSAEVRYAINPQSSVFTAVSFIQGTAQEDAYAFNAGTASARYVREWKGGWIGSASYQYGEFHFQGIDPIFGARRVDTENRAELGISNRYLSYKSISPRVTVGAARRRSTIDFFAFDRYYVRAGVITEF
jgi:outer membrane protein